MKILVCSDSHGDYPQLFRAQEAAGPVDRTVHLGDGAEDARLMEQALGIPVLTVAGNCDRLPRLPAEILLHLGEDTVLVTHGAAYQVKGGLSLLERRALEVGATVVLYGHTHRAALEERGGILFVNPGALAGSGCYAVVTLACDAPPAAHFFRLGPGGALPVSPG